MICPLNVQPAAFRMKGVPGYPFFPDPQSDGQMRQKVGCIVTPAGIFLDQETIALVCAGLYRPVSDQ